ncbi:MAG: pantoate--beta-alanine ligase [Candidatus Kapabacteria bacterium]|nr:pantoate--beta-alanine ligase [Candidatus Kapabacteria bacterium]
MRTIRDIIVVRTVAEMHQIVADARASGATVGCIPTMGYLHDGHASLIRAASKKHRLVVVSIFVNPTQFGPSEDFERYPRNLDHDLKVVAEAGGAVVFAPTVEEMYPDGARSTIHIPQISEILEGASRPTHFDGVATVVSRLFEAMHPDEAFFGQKDLQQTLVIEHMVSASEIDDVRNVTVTVLPTQREHNGLARSSRNVYLTAEDREDATAIYRALTGASEKMADGENSRANIEAAMRRTLDSVSGLTVDYAVAVEASTLQTKDLFISGEQVALLIAVRLGRTRLIDNMVVKMP